MSAVYYGDQTDKEIRFVRRALLGLDRSVQTSHVEGANTDLERLSPMSVFCMTALHSSSGQQQTITTGRSGKLLHSI
jgi:hypothetical protein